MPVPLPVDRIAQLNSRFCGPAVAGMILQFFGQSPTLKNAGWEQLWQHSLWAYLKAATTGPGPPGPLCGGRDLTFPNQQGGTCIGGHCSCWDTTPQALEAVLNDQLPATQLMSVVRKPPAAFLDVTGAIIESIDQRVPAAALGNGGQHWLVVRGYRSGRTSPTPMVIAGRKINGLYVRDSQRANRTFISITWWQDWFDETDCGVVDPVAGYSDHRMLIAIVEGNIGRRMMSKRPGGDGQSVPPPGTAIPITQAMQMSNDLAASLVSDEEPGEGWAEAFAGAKAQEAFLVKRSDRDNNYFWVILFTRNGRETARMALAARTGELLEVESIAAGEDQIEPWVAVPIIPATGTPAPLVWKPCNESPTPLLPFYELPSTGDSPKYLRVDGEMFDVLTRGQGR